VRLGDHVTVGLQSVIGIDVEIGESRARLLQEPR
jgi:hypothetical protein